MGKGAKPGRSKGNVLLLVGALAIVVGIGLLAWGLAPAKALMDAVGPVFSGGAPPEDLSERMDAAMAKLKARAVADGVGFVALLAGFVLVKQAFAKPKPKPVEQLVQEEVARRLAVQQPTHGAPPLPMPQAAVPVATPPAPTTSTVAATLLAPPVPAPPAQPALRRTHCASCASVLVAGGRICPQGHAQA